MKVIDLFCGAGGFSLGFKQAGFDVILGVDIWEKALETYQLNIQTEILNKDVREIKAQDLPACDILIGSPPCPQFSTQRYVNKQLRFAAADLSCINHFMELVKKIKPKYWIWENVLGAKKYIPFLVPYAILDAQNYGVPQRRKRVFVGNYHLPKENKFKGIIDPTIIAWELCGGWDGYNTRRFSQHLGRKPTYQEMAFYMGFPPDYEFLGTQKDKSIQIGNAVCPPVSKAIAEAILISS